MTWTVKAKLNTIILICAITILVSGIFMFAAGCLIDNLFEKELDAMAHVPDVLINKLISNLSNYTQYWAGIPIIITAVVGIVTSRLRIPPDWLKILSAILFIVSMILTLAVIIEDVYNMGGIQMERKILCDGDWANLLPKKFDCERIRGLEASYQFLLLSADIAFVLCLVALLALFANWTLSVQRQQLNGNQYADNGSYSHLSNEYSGGNDDGVLQARQQDYYPARLVQI